MKLETILLFPIELKKSLLIDKFLLEFLIECNFAYDPLDLCPQSFVKTICNYVADNVDWYISCSETDIAYHWLTMTAHFKDKNYLSKDNKNDF